MRIAQRRRYREKKLTEDPDFFNRKQRKAREQNPDKHKMELADYKKRIRERMKTDPNFIPPASFTKDYVKSRESALISRTCKRVGISVEEYHALAAKKEGKCHICAGDETKKNRNGTTMRLALDHCHDSGKARGILCSNCNHGLGNYKDSVDLLLDAANYLEEHQPTIKLLDLCV